MKSLPQQSYSRESSALQRPAWPFDFLSYGPTMHPGLSPPPGSCLLPRAGAAPVPQTALLLAGVVVQALAATLCPGSPCILQEKDTKLSMWKCLSNLSLFSQRSFHRVIESLRLEKAHRISSPTICPSPMVPTKPCPSTQHPNAL